MIDMNKILHLLFKWKLIILASITLSGCPLTVNLNIATDKPISLAVEKPIEVKVGADVAITELPPIRVTRLPPIKVGIASDAKKSDTKK
jgi:hypothetical protein